MGVNCNAAVIFIVSCHVSLLLMDGQQAEIPINGIGRHPLSHKVTATVAIAQQQ